MTQAKIDLSTFLLNETDLTPDEYNRERQNLRSLCVELRDIAKEDIVASREAYGMRGSSRTELAQAERRLAEAEILLIRLFSENKPDQMPLTPAPNTPEEARPPMPPGATTNVIVLPDGEHLTIEQHAAASLKSAKAQLERTIAISKRTPGTFTDMEINELTAKVIEAEMLILATEPDFKENPESQKKFQEYSEQLRDLSKARLSLVTQLRDMVKAKVDRETQLHRDGIITITELDAAKLELIYWEIETLLLTPDLDEAAKRTQFLALLAKKVEIRENAFLIAYAKYQSGTRDGTIANLVYARYLLLHERCEMLENRQRLTDSVAERDEIQSQQKTLLRELYKTARIYDYCVNLMIEVGRATNDDGSKARSLLDSTKADLLMVDPTANIDELDAERIDNIDFADWYYELRPDEKSTGPPTLVVP